MYSDIAANKRRTVLIMLFFIAFVAGVIWLLTRYLGGNNNVFYGGLIGAAAYTLITYYGGSKMSLAVNGARQIQKSDNPQLFRLVENLAITDGLPTPKIYIINDQAPNAFATGRGPKNAVVCVTSGLLEIMDKDELEGVLAHELGHVKNYDIRVNMVAFALTAVISLAADLVLRFTFFNNSREEENSPVFMIAGLIAAILAPFIATLIQLAISRQREYLADATGALTTRYPEALASALSKIEQTGSVMRVQNTATSHFFFANPLKKHSLSNLFSTHPPIEDRIKRLQQMETHA